MTTTKYVFDDSSRSLHRVVGYPRRWEELSPGIRVRRRVIKPHPSEREEPIAWYATFDDEDDQVLG